MKNQFPDVNFVGVSGRAPLADMQDFVNDLGVDGFEHIADEDGVVWSQYDIASQPAFVFIDDSGEVDVTISGLGQSGLTERVEALRS